MNTLILQIENPSLLEQLKSVLSVMKGVKVVASNASADTMALEDVPNAVSLSAMKEVESGNDAGIVRMDNLEAFMASMEE